jgi:hypothetical protein
MLHVGRAAQNPGEIACTVIEASKGDVGLHCVWLQGFP